MFKQREDGVRFFGSASGRYMLYFPNGRPPGWSEDPGARPSARAPRMTEDELKISLGIKERERASMKKRTDKVLRKGSDAGKDV